MAGRSVCVALGQMRLMDCNLLQPQTHTSRGAPQSLGNRNPTRQDLPIEHR